MRAIELHQAYFEEVIAKKAQELAQVSEFVVQEVSRRASAGQEEESACMPCSRASSDADSLQLVPVKQEADKRVLSPEAFAPSNRSRRRTFRGLPGPVSMSLPATIPTNPPRFPLSASDLPDLASVLSPTHQEVGTGALTKTWHDQPTPAFHKPFFSRTSTYAAPSSPHSGRDSCGAGGLSPRPRRSRMFGKATGAAAATETVASSQIKSVEGEVGRDCEDGQSYSRSSSIAEAAPKLMSLSIAPHGSPLARLLAELHSEHADCDFTDVAEAERDLCGMPRHSLYQSTSSWSMASSASGDSDLQSCVSAMTSSSLSPRSSTFSLSSFSTPMSSVGQFFPVDTGSCEGDSASPPTTLQVAGKGKAFDGDNAATPKPPSPSMMSSHDTQDPQEEVEEMLQDEPCGNINSANKNSSIRFPAKI